MSTSRGPRPRKRPSFQAPETGDAMESVRRSSSLPSGVFKRVEPKVEQALTGPVADVFLSHMQAPPPSLQERARRLEPLARNAVEPEEIEAFMADYAQAGRAPAPDIRFGLDSERMWVLADLATNGGGRARELATRELRIFVRRLGATEFADIDLLRALIGAIESRDSQQQVSVLLQVLLASAREALRQIERGGEPGR